MKTRFIAFALLALLQLGQAATQLLADDAYRTPNFIVYAPDPAFAKMVAEKAEAYRDELSELWLGRKLEPWPERCPIQVEIAMHAGGETSFAFIRDQFGNSHPTDWRMKIFGPPDRILDSVLPHEVTHTIFATHFGQPLPRWADEGACTTVEHASEKQKSQQMLIDFLTTQRGIPFNQMFAMKEYPNDILPLYAQGYSVARFLIQQRGHRHFVDFVGAGLRQETAGRVAETWNAVCREFYGYENLSDLQIRWLKWVESGSPQLARVDETPAAEQPLVAANNPGAKSPQTLVSLAPPPEPAAVAAGQSWYVQQSLYGGDTQQTQRPDPNLRGTGHEPRYAPGSIQREVNPRGSQVPGRETIWR